MHSGETLICMILMRKPSTNTQHLYKIGAVSSITGLTTHSIRAWENRYDLKLAKRSKGGTRLYTDKDIVLLSLLRDLTRKGDAIGELAGLSEEELRERLKYYGPSSDSEVHSQSTAEAAPYRESKPSEKSADDSSKVIQAMVLSDTLAEYFDNDVFKGLSWRVHCKASIPEDALAQLDSEDADILLVHVQALGKDPIAFLKQWNEKTQYAPTIVFYDLSNSALFVELMKLGAKMVKWPVDLAVLSQMIMDYSRLYRLNGMKTLNKVIDTGASHDISKRLFSSAQLMKLCQVSTQIDCDYLKNISFILSEIDSLEDYFNNLSDSSEEDTTLHLELHQKTANARALFESMLMAVSSHKKLEGAPFVMGNAQ